MKDITQDVFKDDASSNKLLIRYALRYPWLIGWCIFLGFSGAIFSGIGTALIVPILLGILGEDIVDWKQAPPILQNLMSVFDVFEGELKFYVMILSILLAITLKNAATFANAIVSLILLNNLYNDIRLEALRMLLEVDIDYYSKTPVGTLLNHINGEVSRTSNSIKVFIKGFSLVITILTYIWVLLSISWQLTIISTLLLAVLALTNQFFVKRSRYYGQLLGEKARDYSNKLLEILTGIRLIKTTGNESQEYKAIEVLIHEREQAQLMAQVDNELVGPINEISGILIVLIIVVCGRYLFFNQIKSVATVLLTYLVVLFRLLPFISQLNNVRNSFASTSPAVEIVYDFLKRSNKPFMSKGTKPFTRLHEEIVFHEVSFSYPSNEKLVLRNVNISIPKGTTVALVGASGAGKSTIADLLPRFYDPIQGKITVDGIDLRDFEISTLRSRMGVVSQDTFLFNNTVRYNIAYGLKDVTEKEIIEAAKRANAYEFIVNLPKGLDTDIGDRGVMLSGGQRQRLAIARALLRNPEILILDEATSALDTVSERLVQQAIDELCVDRTTLVIAHRLSTIRKAHSIVVMDQGQVMEVGNHHELLQRGGYYARLYNLQFAHQSEDSSSQNTHSQYHERQNRLSYQIRSRLNAMLGSIRIVADGLVEDSEEQYELLEESYDCAIHLLNVVKEYEEGIKN